MILNAYGGAILKSETDFFAWAANKGIKKPIENKIVYEAKNETIIYDKLIAEGFRIRISPFIYTLNGKPMKIYECFKRENKPQNYKVKKFLYQFIYIANTIGIEYAEKWVDSFKEKEYKQKEYAMMIENKPKIAYCHLKSSQGQCKIDCPFWRGKCQISSAEEQQSRDLLEEYKPLK